jgi:hypothetical protein
MKGVIMKPSLIVTVIFILLVSLVHLIRLIFKWRVMVNTVEIPLWASGAACIVTVVLVIWLWKEN